MKRCPTCDEELESRADLRTHFDADHREPRPGYPTFTCADCGRVRELPSYWNPRIAPPSEPEHPRRRLCLPCFEESLGAHPPTPPPWVAITSTTRHDVPHRLARMTAPLVGKNWTPEAG